MQQDTPTAMAIRSVVPRSAVERRRRCMVLGADGAAIQTRAAYVSDGGYGTLLQAYKQKVYGLRG